MKRKTIRDVHQDVYYDALDKGLSEDAARWHADIAMQQQMEMELEAELARQESEKGL